MRHHHYHYNHHTQRRISEEISKDVVAFYNTFKRIPLSCHGKVIFALNLKTGHFSPRKFNPDFLEGRISSEEASSLVNTVKEAKSWSSYKSSLPERILYTLWLEAIAVLLLLIIILFIIPRGPSQVSIRSYCMLCSEHLGWLPLLSQQEVVSWWKDRCIWPRGSHSLIGFWKKATKN